VATSLSQVPSRWRISPAKLSRTDHSLSTVIGLPITLSRDEFVKEYERRRSPGNLGRGTETGGSIGVRSCPNGGPDHSSPSLRSASTASFVNGVSRCWNILPGASSLRRLRGILAVIALGASRLERRHLVVSGDSGVADQHCTNVSRAGLLYPFCIFTRTDTYDGNIPFCPIEQNGLPVDSYVPAAKPISRFFTSSAYSAPSANSLIRTWPASVVL
jgi:hypothetical protein